MGICVENGIEVLHLGSRLLRNVSQIEHAKIPIRQESESDSLNALIIKVHNKALSACKVKFYTLKFFKKSRYDVKFSGTYK